MIKPRRIVPRLHYTLLMCSLRGHEFVGTDASSLRPQDSVVAREENGVRWYRCLRCDSWLPRELPKSPPREFPPNAEEIALPIRGKPLRDLFILRAIATLRAFKGVFLIALGVGIFIFAAKRTILRDQFYSILAQIEGEVVGKGGNGHHGVIGLVEKLLSYDSIHLHVFGAAVLIYATVNIVEAVGLWYDKRWAEYLAFCVITAFIPIEIYELSVSITPLKVMALGINIFICLYLLIAKRLFGVRGGYAALMVAHDAEVSWEALERATPGHPGWRPPF